MKLKIEKNFFGVWGPYRVFRKTEHYSYISEDINLQKQKK